MLKEFNSFLLREKFDIFDPTNRSTQNKSVTTALSNRLAVTLSDGSPKQTPEVFIVRAHNMHSAVRMGARLIQAYNTGGPITGRKSGFEWGKAWDGIVNDYEHAYNPERWIALYYRGKCIFQSGDHHPLLDLIEKCAEETKGDYDSAVPMAENLFLKTGKSLKIDHNSNVALSIHFENNQGRLGIIQRGPDKTTTFTFSVSAKKGKILNIPQCLGAAAAFLEGVQLCFLVGMNTIKIRFGKIERFSKEEKQTKEARKRISRLTGEINNLENEAEVRYRPEKPDFPNMIIDAEQVANKIVMAQIAEEEAAEEARKELEAQDAVQDQAQT